MSDARLFRPLTVAPAHAGWRVDAYLSARFASWSRAAVQRAIKRGEVESDRRPKMKASHRLEGGEVLRIYTAGYAPDAPPPPLPTILHEDDRLIVIDKPPGLLAHPAGDRFTYAIIGLFKEARPDERIDLCHRLDRDTSGVMVLSKDVAANDFVKDRLRRRAGIAKTYLALVRGVVPWDTQQVHAPIGDRPDTEIRLRRGVVDGGQPAHTTVTVVQRLAQHTLVSCALHTGRTHQIRVHLEHVGHAILGDRVYGQPDRVFLEWHEQGPTDFVRANAGFPRQCLHAWRLRLPHPSGGTLDVQAPLPADMKSVVDGAVPHWPGSEMADQDR